MSAGPRFGDDIERGKTLEFSQSVTYPGTVDEVVAMFLSPGYQERRFGSFVVEGSSSAVVEGDRITFSGTVRPELIPSAASRFVKGDLRVTFVEEWSRDEAVAPASGRVSAGIGGDARVAGPATTSAAVPASARSVAGFFVVMCVTPMCDGRSRKNEERTTCSDRHDQHTADKSCDKLCFTKRNT